MPLDRLAQVEKNLVEISGNLPVQAKLMDRLEQQTADFHRETRARLERVETQTDAHAVELQEFRATAARVLDLLERFISGRGQSGNGANQ